MKTFIHPASVHCALPLLLFVLAALTNPHIAVAAGMTFYVDIQSAQAADTNPGTKPQPFKTIRKAADTAQAGDTVVVRPGLYREEVILHNSGTPEAPITFLSESAGKATITGADLLTGWTRVPGSDAPVYSIPWDHLFEISRDKDGHPVEHHPEDASLWGRAEQAIADGVQLLPALSLDSLTAAWKSKSPKAKEVATPLPKLGPHFAGQFAVDTAHKLLYVWLADGSDPNTHRMEASTRGLIFGCNPWANPTGVHDVVVRGFHFQYGASFPQRAAVWLHGAHNTVENCLIESMAGSGVNVSGTLRRCHVRDCGHTGGSATGDGFTDEDCVWEDNDWKPIDRGWDGGGVKIAQVKGGDIRRCVFRRNGGPGLWFDIDVRDVQVSECVFVENEGSGLFNEISRRNSIDRCLFLRNAVGAVGNKAGWGECGLTLAESAGCTVTHCTFVGNKDGIGFREQGPRPLDTAEGTLPYHDVNDIVTNNLSVNNVGFALALWWDNDYFGPHPSQASRWSTDADFDAYLKTVADRVYDPRRQHLTIDGNIYLPVDGRLVRFGVDWRKRHRDFSNLDAWIEQSMFDAHSVVLDPTIPLFVDATNDDYRATQNSPARSRDAGWLEAPERLERWTKDRLPDWENRS